MPKSWLVSRKSNKFIIKPLPGSHNLELSIPLGIILRDYLKYAETLKEVKLILNNENIFVNGKKVTSFKYNCGLFDIIEIEKNKEKFIILYNKVGRVILVNYNSTNLFLKVSNKTILKGGKYSLNFSNGYNILVDLKTFKTVKINDTVVFDYKTKKIKDIISFKEGNFLYVFKGNYVGLFGKVLSITKYNGVSNDLVEIETENDKVVTSLSNCYMISKNKKDLNLFREK